MNIKQIISYVASLWQPTDIWYNMKSLGEAKSVSDFLKEQQEQYGDLLDKIIKQNNFHLIEDDDELILVLLKWVKNNITYTSDKVQYKKVEYWANIKEILESKKDDCEGGATLLYSLAYRLNFHPDKIKFMVGDVDGGGHAWVGYKSERFPYVWYFMDWCYWYDRRPIETRIPYFLKSNREIVGDDKYFRAWWFADTEHAYRRYQ